MPFTTMWAACTSPPMRASEDTTSVPGSPARPPTLPRTTPSTRNPPLKMTLPSMRVVAPIRLSMRFCGLLCLLNILPPCPSQTHGGCGAGRVRASLVHAHLNVLDPRLGIHPKRAFDAPEVLERQPELGRRSVPWFREGHHSILPPTRQADHQLEAAVEFAFAPRARRDEEQVVAVFARQHVRLDREAI